MPGLDAARLRALADELDQEEAEARRELEDAETKSEREKLEGTIAELQAKQTELEQRLAAADDPPPPPGPGTTEDEEGEEGQPPKQKTRKGRKHGMVYQDKPGSPGEVWQGADEDDIVVISEEDAA